MEVRWDPKSENYLLAAFKNGRVALIDTMTFQVLSVFQKPNAGVLHLRWIPHQPGGFLTSDTRTGILREWNVANKEFVKINRLLPSPIHSMIPLANPPTPLNSSNDSKVNQTTYFLITFADGSVGVYDIGDHQWLYIRIGGHSETIFGCALRGSHGMGGADIVQSEGCVMATASFDGTVKLWRVEHSTAARSVKSRNEGAKEHSTHSTELVHLDTWPSLDVGKVDMQSGRMVTSEGSFYHVTFSPPSVPGLQVMTASSKGAILLFDVIREPASNATTVSPTTQHNPIRTNVSTSHLKLKMRSRFVGFHNTNVFHLSWTPFGVKTARTHRSEDPTYSMGVVASACSDGIVTVFSPADGVVLRRYNHVESVFGCDFNPFRP